MNEINITVIDRQGDQHDLKVPTDMGLNLMETLKSYELPVEGICGGMAMCASCHCYILSDHDLPEQGHDEIAMLDETDEVESNSRLACQIQITNKLEGLKLELAPELVGEDEFSDW